MSGELDGTLERLVRTCLRKKKVSQKRANKIIALSPYMRKYYCMECYGWHLTTQEKLTGDRRDK